MRRMPSASARLHGLPEAQHDDLAHARVDGAGDSSANGACSQREPIPLQRARAASHGRRFFQFPRLAEIRQLQPKAPVPGQCGRIFIHPERNNFPCKLCIPSPTFKAAPHDSARAYRAVAEALIKSQEWMAREITSSQGLKKREYFVYFKCGNRWIPGKYPPSTADDLFRVSSNMISQKAADANINLDAASAIFAASPHRRRAVRERHSLTCGERRSASAALQPLRGSPCPAARGGRCPYRAAGRRQLPSAPLRAHRS